MKKNAALLILLLSVFLNSCLAEDVFWDTVNLGEHFEENFVTLHYCMNNQLLEIADHDKYIVSSDYFPDAIVLASNQTTKNENVRLYAMNKYGKIIKQYDCFLPNIKRVVAMTNEYLFFFDKEDDRSYLRRMNRRGDIFTYVDPLLYDNISISSGGHLCYRNRIAFLDNESIIYLKDYLPTGYKLDDDWLSASAWIDDHTLLFWAYKEQDPLSTFLSIRGDSYLMVFDLTQNTVKPLVSNQQSPICTSHELIAGGMYFDTASNTVYAEVSSSNYASMKDPYSLEKARHGISVIQLDLNTGVETVLWDSGETVVPYSSSIAVIHG